MCLKVDLETKTRNKMLNNHNAACPMCLDTWEFDLDYARSFMSSVTKKQFMRQGFIYVICEGCCHNPEIDEIEEMLVENEIHYTHEVE